MNEIVNCQSDPAESKESDCKKDLDYSIKVLCPYILDAPDAADKAYKPYNKSDHSKLIFKLLIRINIPKIYRP